ncbi:MAG: hypothetical protein CM15mP126_3050 [Gammaproteobacteria bacterium]|nr:MAG: hypothetical protein CM15mP126_3050 [Gammaproteobacteria bacterium]
MHPDGLKKNCDRLRSGIAVDYAPMSSNTDDDCAYVQHNILKIYIDADGNFKVIRYFNTSVTVKLREINNRKVRIMGVLFDIYKSYL